MAIPTLDPLWRQTATRNDRELIRGYASLPASEMALQGLTVQLNGVAEVSPPTVTQVQKWIDEIETLQQDYSDQVSDQTAHLGAVKSYEGLRPGASPTRADQLRAAGPLQWDTESVLKVRYEAGEGPAGTAVGQSAGRMADLKARVLTAVGIEQLGAAAGAFMLERS
jgi:hypothetical protein